MAAKRMTPAEAAAAERAAVLAERRAGRKRWDLIVSIVMLLALAWVCLSVTYVGVTLSFLPTSCDTNNLACDFDIINAGFAIALLAPTPITLVVVAITIIRYLRGRRAFWIPFIGIALCFAAGVVGSLMVVAGVPGSALY